MLLHGLEVPLPRLVVLGQVREGDHLRVEPEPRLHRLQHRRVRDADEAVLPGQVPHKVPAADARALDLPELVHGREGLRRVHKVRRGEGRRRPRQEEAVVDAPALLPHQPRDVCDRRHRHAPGQGQRLQATEHVVHVDARDLDGWRTVAPGRLAPSHPPVPIVHDALLHDAAVALLHRLGDAQLAVEARVHAAVGLLRIHRHRGPVPIADPVHEKLAVPGGAAAVAALGDDVARQVRPRAWR
mmetsp:Transcript_32224/g.74811  ORF Transcript_32224/g.74811 Transcript_32224/m.74811 type:complete len:242 (+) Transcript_32224:609-1334(+)